MSRISFMDYAVFLIVGLSLLLRVLFLGNNSLLGEEAYYWNYAQHLDLSYLDHPPMVAVLIKLTTSIFGTHEFSVRISSVLCWLLTAFFSFKLTNLIARGAGLYAVMLLAILPFFFLHSLVITPDQPLVVCWSATLYCLYRSLILDEPSYWYGAGVWIGLGLLSKYTIVLLGPATLLYICIVPTARPWLTRKEPYACALIAALLFTPVIYWNATHEWISFLFQSTRRIESTFYFSFHHFIGLLLLFLMPAGVWGLWSLIKNNARRTSDGDIKTIRFFQIFTGFPLIFFGLFSLSHGLKFNWIGPGLLALIPWLAWLIKQESITKKHTLRNSWLITASLSLLCYYVILFVTSYGTPETIYNKLFIKYIDWDNLTQQVRAVARRVEIESNTIPIIVPLDLYVTSSELTFYQAKFLKNGDINKSYPIIGDHIVGRESLMYRYWSKKENFAGRTLIIISNNLKDFDDAYLKKRLVEKSPIATFWSQSQVHGAKIQPYYYQVVQLKTVKADLL